KFRYQASCSRLPSAHAVEDRDCLHFVRRELPRDNSHLFKDIVLTHALRESDKLYLDVVGLLPLQRGRSEFVPAGTMAGRAGRDATLGGAGKYQAFRGVRLPEAAARLRHSITREGWQPAALGREIGRHIGRILK